MYKKLTTEKYIIKADQFDQVIKILRENLQDLGLDKGLLDMTPKAQLIKGKKSINYTLLKLKAFAQ